MTRISPERAVEAEAGKGSRRKKVYIGKTEDGILHAVFEKDGKSGM